MCSILEKWIKEPTIRCTGGGEYLDAARLMGRDGKGIRGNLGRNGLRQGNVIMQSVMKVRRGRKGMVVMWDKGVN